MTSSDIHSAYPLDWPVGWRRTESYRRTRAAFKSARRELSVIEGVERVLRELRHMGIDREDVVISTNAPTRLDGLPKSNTGWIGDPGAAVYWRQKRQTRCMALDRYDRLADNLAAIAATLDAMRAIERHGGAEILDRAFTGFTALPAPEQWFQVLGVSANASVEEIESAHRKLAMQHHPDRGGDTDTMARINSARDQAMESRA